MQGTVPCTSALSKDSVLDGSVSDTAEGIQAHVAHVPSKWTMQVDHQTGPSCETISADQMATLSADHENSIEPPDASYSPFSDNGMLLAMGSEYPSECRRPKVH